MSESPYYYTQGKFWGGATASTMIYMILAIFPLTGFFGIDHLYLHSPGTFVMKAILNVVTFGYWYFHDVIQAVSFESEDVKDMGLSVPWFGPSGIGAGGFKGEGVAEAPQNNLMYVAYVLSAMFIPFGLDYVIAGDYKGALFKYASIFMLGAGFIFGLINVFKIIMKPAEVFCEGTYRYPPFTWGGAARNNPDVNFTTKVGCPTGPAGDGGGLSILDFIKQVVFGLEKIPVIGPKVAGPAKAVIATAETAVATAEQTYYTAQATAQTALNVGTAAVDMAVNKVPEAIKQANQIAAMVTPAGIAAAAMKNMAAEPAAKVVPIGPAAAPAAPANSDPTNPTNNANNNPTAPTQSGGGIGDSPQPITIFALSLIFIGSAYITLQRSFKRVKEYFADMPPMLQMPTIKNNFRVSDVNGELPPQPSESNLF
jgi:hypothetical protein